MAKLDLPEQERAWAASGMNKLAKDFDALQDINTTGLEPLVSVLDIKNVLREDVAVKTISRATLLASAPEEYDGYFQVPKTL